MTLLVELDAFYLDHGRCGELEAGVDGPVVWIGCECGAEIARRADEGRPSGEDLAVAKRYAELKIALALAVLGFLVLVVVGIVLPAMSAWKWLQLIGLMLASLGAAIIVLIAGVPWILPNRPRYGDDVWLWKGSFALMVVGMVLQFIGTVLSP